MTDAQELLRAALRSRREASRARARGRTRAPRPPKQAERGNEDDLRRLARQVGRIINADLAKHLAFAARAERKDAELNLGEIGIDLEGIRIKILRLVRRRAPAIATAIADRTNRNNQEIIARLFNIDVARESPQILAALSAARDANVALITRMADEQLAQVRRLVNEAGTSGMRAATLAKRLQERLAIGERRAALIARDQTLKINGQLTQIRQRDAGVERYVWSTSQDERVREMHAELEGQTFSWDDPPVTNEQGDTNHPGEDYQCRCIAIPVIPE